MTPPGGRPGCPAARVRWLLAHLEDVVGGAAFVGMTAIVFVNVCARYLLNDPIPGADELATLGFTWAVFLGASAAVRERLHLGIELATRRLSPPARAWVGLLATALMAAFAVLIGIYGARLIETAHLKRTPVLQWSYVWVYLAVPLGAALMLVRLAGIARGQWADLRATARVPAREGAR